MPANREEIETEIAAFVGSWLDGADEIYQAGWSIGTFGFVFEVEYPPDEDGPSGYTDIGFTCSDPRAWIQAGLFRRAMLSAERESEQTEEE
jgi:hypothetical protein